jgi:hypothetical protein
MACWDRNELTHDDEERQIRNYGGTFKYENSDTTKEVIGVIVACDLFVFTTAPLMNTARYLQIRRVLKHNIHFP